MSADIRVAPLEAAPGAFRSGRDELDEWFEQHALAATRGGSARVYVAERADEVVGYLALAAGSVERSRAGRRTRAGMPGHPIPVVLLARLAVAVEAQAQGVGRELVRHAAATTLEVARLVAVRALAVDAIDGRTAGFYRRVGVDDMSLRRRLGGTRSSPSRRRKRIRQSGMKRAGLVPLGGVRARAHHNQRRSPGKSRKRAPVARNAKRV